ncbi:peptidoglycan editing factor PgeF [Algicella marina]|uniref:Purine nucleoside phosphorylase n=1 Tax=Algicella marina TaxID=2683284 RepID=A0A6P1SXG4_9RHOB|nr:peptidoglycan editing factor PgeF [Algicella marina]QHQ33709.1 peptidoglycan editing factor PgeF [Algicella marina]
MMLEILTSPDLPASHGFFTRRGGASSGIFHGLNCGPGSSDLAEAVSINRARVAKAMEIPLDHLISLHQHHSSDVVVLTAPPESPPKADAMVTAMPGLALGILTADCAPVLFCDRTAMVIGAAHSGWRGALGGVLENTLDAMESLGATRSAITAVVGPTISQRAYEVGPEFFENFVAEDREFVRFFAGGHGDRMQFDLPGLIVHRLRSSGIGDASWTGHCTFTDAGSFYSFRRTTHAGEADYGRLISVIRL